jgi:hypothetical protein
MYKRAITGLKLINLLNIANLGLGSSNMARVGDRTEPDRDRLLEVLRRLIWPIEQLLWSVENWDNPWP